jgi:hypothetical protein
VKPYVKRSKNDAADAAATYTRGRERMLAQANLEL